MRYVIPENFCKSTWGAERPGHKYLSRKAKAGGGYDYEYAEETPKHEAPKEPEWKIHSVKDLRPIDWYTGKRIALATGEGATCDRCGKEHAIVYKMEHQKTGKQACVGSGCGPGMAGGTHNLDDDSIKQAEKEAKQKVLGEARKKLDDWVAQIREKLVVEAKFPEASYFIGHDHHVSYAGGTRKEVQHPRLKWGFKGTDNAVNVGEHSSGVAEYEVKAVMRKWLTYKIATQVKEAKIPESWPFPKDLKTPRETVARQALEVAEDLLWDRFKREAHYNSHQGAPSEMLAHRKPWEPDFSKSMHDELHVISADDFDLCMSWSGRLTDAFEFDRAVDLIKGAMHKYLRRYPSGKASPRWYYIYKVTNKYMGKPVAEGEKIKITHDGKVGHYEVEKVHPNGYATVKHDETGQRMSVKQEHLHEMFSEEHKAAIDEAHTRLKHTFDMAKIHGNDVQRENARNALKEHEDRYEIKTPERLAVKRANKLTVLTGVEPSVENHLAAAEANQQAADMGVPQADMHREAAALHRSLATQYKALQASAAALKDPDNRFHVPAEAENKASTPVLVMPKVKGPRKAKGAFFGSKEQAYSALKGAHEVNENFLDQFHKADSVYRAWKAGRGPKPSAHTGGDLDHLNQALGLVEPKRRLGKAAPDPRVSSPAEAWDRLVSRDKRWDGTNSRKAIQTFQEWFTDHGIKLHLPEDAEIAINVRAQAEADASYAAELGGEHEEAKLQDHIAKLADEDATFDPEQIEGDLDTSFDFGLNAEAEEDDPKEAYQKQGIKAKSFRGWFGDYEKDPQHASKVVNAKGEPAEQHNMAPMPVYHGTAVGGFTAFDPAKVSTYNIFGEGFYFTEDKGIAKEYTEKDSDDAKWNSMHGITDASGKEITHLPAKWATKVIASTPGYGGERSGDHTDWDASNTAAALKRAMEPQGVNVIKFLQEYRRASGPVLDAKGEPNKYTGERNGSPMGLHALMKRLAKDKVGDFKPAVTPPQVLECYLNVRKPIDMDTPISKEDFRDLAGYMNERMKDQYRPQYLGDAKAGPDKWEHQDSLPFYTKNLNDHPDIRAMGDDAFNKSFTYDDFLKAKGSLRKDIGEKDKPAYPIFHLSEESTLTWGDVHFIMSDGHNYQTEKRLFKDWAQKRGYDGISHTGGWNVGAHAHKVWIAWAPNQIKAVGNEGTFNATTNDIYKAMNPNIFVIIPAKVRYLDLLEKAGGPYVGPRGGLWADPQHTQHWEPNQPTTLIPKEELDDKVTELAHLSHEDLASIKKQQEEYLAKLDASGEAVPVAAMRLARIIDRAIEKKGPKLVATVPVVRKKERKPEAGGPGVESATPKIDAVLWTTDSDVGHLEQAKIVGRKGDFDGYSIWEWEWLSGPNKGKKESSYSHSFWTFKKPVASTLPEKAPIPDFDSELEDKAVPEMAISLAKQHGLRNLKRWQVKVQDEIYANLDSGKSVSRSKSNWSAVLDNAVHIASGFKSEPRKVGKPIPTVPEKPAPTKMVAKVPSNRKSKASAQTELPLTGIASQTKPVVEPKKETTEVQSVDGKLEAVGEHIWGSRKDLAQMGRITSPDQLNTMSFDDAVHIVRKKNLIPALDMQQLKEAGMSPGTAHMTLALLSAIKEKPSANTAGQKKYVEDVSRVLKATLNCKNLDAFRIMLNEFQRESYGVGKWERVQTFEHGEDAQAILEKLQKENPGAGYVMGHSFGERLIIKPAIKPFAELGTGFTSFLKRKGKAYNAVYTDALTADNDWGYSKAAKIEDGWAFLQSRGELKNVAKQEEISKRRATIDRAKERGLIKESDVETAPEEVKRKGGKKLTTDDAKVIKESLGLREIDFGQEGWMSQKDRQYHLQRMNEAMHDFAEVLNVDPKTMSFNGRLGIALGARGRGKAAAHYETGRHVINLTKFSGGGSLAHEWGHAMDNIFAEMFFGTKAGVGVSYLTHAPESPKLPEEVKRAMANLDKAIKKHPDPLAARNAHNAKMAELRTKRNDLVTENNKLVSELKVLKMKPENEQQRLDKVAAHKKLVEGAKKMLAEHTAKYQELEKDPKELRRYGKHAHDQVVVSQFSLERHQKRLEVLSDPAYVQTDEHRTRMAEITNKVEGDLRYDINRTENEIAVLRKTDPEASDFYKYSAGEKYWGSPHELFARAFSTFAEDTLKDHGRENTYLVWEKSEAGRYPQGKERSNINAAIHNLFDALVKGGHFEKALHFLDSQPLQRFVIPVDMS